MTEQNQPAEEADERAEETPRTLEGFAAVGFFTADNAVVESGKVYANGAYWRHLNFPAFPAGLSSMSIVAVIQVPWHANNSDHEMTVELVDSDGKLLPTFQVKGSFRGAPGPHMRYGEPGVMPIAIPVYGLQFEKPGDYSFVLKVDGKEIERYVVTVVQVAGMGSPQIPLAG